jgi:transmembrane sensor
MTDPLFNSMPSESDSLDDAAAQWLVTRDRGFSPVEAGRFATWLSTSQAHAQAWKRATELWDSFDDEEEDLLAGAMRRAALAARPDRQQQVRRILVGASAIAATLVIAVIGVREVGPRFFQGGKTEPALAQTHPDFQTAVGAQSTVTLADGSQVALDTNSAISVAYTPGRRDIHLLRGQAFFTVAPRRDRPFTVDAGGRDVTALGTAFNVRLDTRNVTVVLARGHVAITRPGAPGQVGLSPGFMFQAGPGETGTVTKADLDQALAWRTGYLEFHNEPLASAVAEMDRYGGGRVTLGDPDLGLFQVNGRFKTGDPVRFARVLADIYPLRVIEVDGGVKLVRR